MTVDLLELADRLRGAWCRDTSELPFSWTPERPSTGQCHVSSLILREFFGGEVVEGLVVCGQAWVAVHYWLVVGGVSVDVTRDQFPGDAQVIGGLVAGVPNETTVAKSALLRQLAGLDRVEELR